MNLLHTIVMMITMLFFVTNGQMHLQTFGILMRYEVDDSTDDTLKIQQIMKFYQKLTCNYKITQVTFQFPIGRMQRKQTNLEALYKSISTSIQFEIYPIKSQGNTLPSNNKFMIPKSNLEEIYFLTNTQLYQNFGCFQLQELLGAYQMKLVGQLGPLVGYYEASHTYQTKEPPGDKIDKDHNITLQYIQNSNSLYYSMIKPEQAFVSKHFLELYYTNLTEIVALRKIVDTHKDCQGIALNCLVSLYYPQLRPWKLNRNERLSAPVFEYGKQSKSETKNACMKEIFQLYGYFPLTNYASNLTNLGLQLWQNPAYTTNVNRKKNHFDVLISQIAIQLVPEIPFKQLVHQQVENSKIELQNKKFKIQIFNIFQEFIQKYGLLLSVLSAVALLLFYLYKKKEQQQLYTTISASFFQQQPEQQQLK